MRYKTGNTYSTSYKNFVVYFVLFHISRWALLVRKHSRSVRPCIALVSDAHVGKCRQVHLLAGPSEESFCRTNQRSLRVAVKSKIACTRSRSIYQTPRRYCVCIACCFSSARRQCTTAESRVLYYCFGLGRKRRSTPSRIHQFDISLKDMQFSVSHSRLVCGLALFPPARNSASSFIYSLLRRSRRD